MACFETSFVAILLGLITLASSKPIMVSFGTNQGPIVPRQPKLNSLQPRTIVARSPAPVKEERQDVPNPNQYRAPVPHQYRTKLYSFRPTPNLIFGTPLDQKYTPNIEKYNKQYSRNLGVDYTGPHIFEKQDYEIYEARKTTLQPSVKYNKPHYYRQGGQFGGHDNQKYVPQIGVIYSAGVRYYVPQIGFYRQTNQYDDLNNAEDENSVYDKHDEKYYRYNNQQ